MRIERLAKRGIKYSEKYVSDDPWLYYDDFTDIHQIDMYKSRDYYLFECGH